jgi:AcrR family transcriptional regulator
MNVGHVMTTTTDTEPPGRVELKREARTSAILDAAMAILAAEGLEALTLGRLAKALGYVPAALYRYFDSKDALLAALQRRAVITIHRGFGEAQRAVEPMVVAAPPGIRVLARLLAGARFYLAVPRTDPEAAFLVALLLGDPRPLLSDDESRRTAPMLLALLGDVETIFEAAEACGVLSKGDGLERTLALWAALSGALSLEKVRRIAPALPSSVQIGSVAVEALLVGWGAAPRDVQRASRLIAKSSAKKARS